MVLTHGTHPGVDGCTVTHVIPVNILSGPGALWLDNLPLFLAPSWQDQERAPQPAKFKLGNSYIKNHLSENKTQLKTRLTCRRHMATKPSPIGSDLLLEQ
jgi:hypothetical protein